MTSFFPVNLFGVWDAEGLHRYYAAFGTGRLEIRKNLFSIQTIVERFKARRRTVSGETFFGEESLRVRISARKGVEAEGFNFIALGIMTATFPAALARRCSNRWRPE
jgi:hypothetical protein